jgi:hypothetical protein
VEITNLNRQHQRSLDNPVVHFFGFECAWSSLYLFLFAVFISDFLSGFLSRSLKALLPIFLVVYKFLSMCLQFTLRMVQEIRAVPALHIKAEKLAKGTGGPAGIYVSVLKNPEEVERRCCLFNIECRSNIGFTALMKILKKELPNYHIKNYNCWDYARRTTKSLLQACIDTKREGCEDHRRLQVELEGVEYKIVRHHFVNTVKSAGNYLKTEVWDRVFS